MKPMEEVAIGDFQSEIFNIFDKQWFLLTAGNFSEGCFNTMTVSWGFMGTMWQLPMVMAVVRPQRYTMEFLERCDTFTLSAFAPEYRKALALLGSESGRDGDKIAASGLTPVAAGRVEAPTFAEAELVIECRKQMVGQMRGHDFVNKKLIREFYPERDYHRTVFGSVVRIARVPQA